MILTIHSKPLSSNICADDHMLSCNVYNNQQPFCRKNVFEIVFHFRFYDRCPFAIFFRTATSASTVDYNDLIGIERSIEPGCHAPREFSL